MRRGAGFGIATIYGRSRPLTAPIPVTKRANSRYYLCHLLASTEGAGQMVLPVKSFQNCPDLDCGTFRAPTLYGDKVPDNLRSLVQRGEPLVCNECQTVWYEERHLDFRYYNVLRQSSANKWLESPHDVTHVKEFRAR